MQIDQVVSGVRDALTAKRVYGDPIERDGATIIPAATVRGGAGGGGEEQRAGAGFGLVARPVGAFVFKDGKVHYRPAIDVNRAVLGGQIVAGIALHPIGALIRARTMRPRLLRRRLLARRLMALRR
jgi:uncharacterized spore protein YtfJ